MMTQPTDTCSLHDRRILTTGASSGIRAAVARQYTQIGALLVLNGHDAQRRIGVEPRLDGNGHESIIGDITDIATLDTQIQACTCMRRPGLLPGHG